MRSKPSINPYVAGGSKATLCVLASCAGLGCRMVVCETNPSPFPLPDRRGEGGHKAG